MAVASRILQQQIGQQDGSSTTYEDLQELSSFRIFDVDTCSCPAYCGPRLCFHTVALRLHLRLTTLPPTLDDTPLGASLMHRPPLAPGRGSPALAPVLATSTTPARRRFICKSSGMGVGGAALPVADMERPALMLADTAVWRCLEALSIPPDIINSIFTGLSQIFGEPSALQLLDSEWFRDWTDRWVPFASIIAARRPARDDGPVLPSVVEEFQALFFVIHRCAVAQTWVPANVYQSDEARLAELCRHRFAHHEACGHNNNCLVHS